MKSLTKTLNEALNEAKVERWIEFVILDDDECPKANAWMLKHHKMSLTDFGVYLNDHLVTGDSDGACFSSQGMSTAKEVKDAFNLRLPDGSKAIDVADELSEMPEVQDYLDEYGGSIGTVMYVSEELSKNW